MPFDNTNDKKQEVNGDHLLWKVLGIKVIKPAIITDAWHLVKFLMITCYAIAFGILTPYFLGLPIFYILWQLGFSPTYYASLK